MKAETGNSEKAYQGYDMFQENTGGGSTILSVLFVTSSTNINIKIS